MIEKRVIIPTKFKQISVISESNNLFLCELNNAHAIYDAKEGGGILRDFGVYAIAFMEHFLGGYPDEMIGKSRISSHGIDADWQITAKRGNVQAFVNLSSNFGSLSKAAVIGKNGFVEWNSQFNRTNTVTLYDANGVQVETFAASYEFEGFEHEVNEVQKCISDGVKESSLVKYESTFNVQKIIKSIIIIMYFK